MVFIFTYVLFVIGPLFLVAYGLAAKRGTVLYVAASLSIPATVYTVAAYSAYWFLIAPIGLVSGGYFISRRQSAALWIGSLGLLPFLVLIGYALIIDYFIA